MAEPDAPHRASSISFDDEVDDGESGPADQQETDTFDDWRFELSTCTATPASLKETLTKVLVGQEELIERQKQELDSLRKQLQAERVKSRKRDAESSTTQRHSQISQRRSFVVGGAVAALLAVVVAAVYRYVYTDSMQPAPIMSNEVTLALIGYVTQKSFNVDHVRDNPECWVNTFYRPEMCCNPIFGPAGHPHCWGDDVELFQQCCPPWVEEMQARLCPPR